MPFRLTPSQQPSQNRPFSGNGYQLPNGAHSGPVPGAQPLLPNQGRIVQQGPTRILCVADVRGMPISFLTDQIRPAHPP